MTEKEINLALELIREKIDVIRGQKVMLDRDLAAMYGVETVILNKAQQEILSDFQKILLFDLMQINISL